MNAEEWLARNTFQCAVGRMTPAQCEALRARPSLREVVAGGSGPRTLPRPGQCETCRGWEDYVSGGDESVMSEATKTCRVCARDLPLSAFWGDRKTKDGRKSICKECEKRRRAEKRKAAKQSAEGHPLLASPIEGEEHVGMPTKVDGDRKNRRPVKVYGQTKSVESAPAGRRESDRGLPQAPAAVNKDVPHEWRVTLDFQGYPHLMELVKGAAHREMRPLELQILWILSRALGAGEEEKS